VADVGLLPDALQSALPVLPVPAVTAAVVEHRYEPRGSCKTLFASRAPEILMSGPAGTGKSRACLEKLLLMALKYPGMRALIARKTGVSLTSTTLVTWREHVAKEAIGNGVCWFYGGSREEPAQYRFSNGSAIVVGGLDNPTKIMSSEYDVAYVGEAIELTVTDWESITTRLRNGVMPYQQLIADTNPDVPHHWLKLRCDTGQTQILESRHADNPVYVNRDGSYTEKGEAYIVGKLEKLTGPRKLRLADGKWVSAEGVIYDGFDATVHLLDRFPIPDDWPRFWAVDFGFTNPFVCQWWAMDPDGRMYLYREIYRTQRLVEDHAKDIIGAVSRRDPEYVHPDSLERLPFHGRVWSEPKPRAIICDHDAEGRATLAKHLGLNTKAAMKTVTEGIQAAQARLKVAGDGKPRLFLLRDAVVRVDKALAEAGKPTSSVQEILGYVWADTKKKEEPVKEGDHGMDAMRYFVADRDLAPRPNLRFL
jgi:phage terminase large subunit